MKLKHEKGFTGIDTVVALLIFIFASSIILGMYFNLYVNVVTIKIHETAIGVMTDVFEKIDLENYDNVTETKIAEFISTSGANEYFNEEKNNSKVTYELKKYSDEHPGVADLVKQISITVKYQINGTDKHITLNKVKIRE